MTFLDSVAQYFLSNQSSSDWSNLTFVFPNRRSGVFFEEALKRCVAKSGGIVFGVRVKTLGDWLAELVDCVVPDNMTLKCRLYRSYLKVCDEPVDFESFYSWAGAILNDFDDIDKYLVDASKLYSNVSDLSQLEDHLEYATEAQRQAIESFWGSVFSKVPGDDGEEKFVYERFSRFVDMAALYAQFRKDLSDESLAYSGMVYRDAVKLVADTVSADSEMRYVFVGFSMLCGCEEKIMATLHDRHLALFFWDFTPEMELDMSANDVHSLGYAVNKWRTLFPAPADFVLQHEELGRSEGKFSLVEVGYQQEQTDVVYSKLTEWKNLFDGQSTAVVVSDESMLIPTLDAIPNSYFDVNVTMGYSLKYSQLSSFVRLLAILQKTMWQKVAADGTVSFNSRIVLQVLQHPCAVFIAKGAETSLQEKEKAIRDVVWYLTKHNRIYISANDLTSCTDSNNAPIVLQPQLVNLFRIVQKDEVVAYLESVVHSIYEYLLISNDALSREVVREALSVIRRLPELFNMVVDNVLDARLLLAMASSVIEQQDVDFMGAPIATLQVLGVLETRCVDFDNVILLDMNEGCWPKSHVADSMIPANLRYGYGLPTQDVRDSAYTYYFYRLIHRAKRVCMSLSQGKGRKSEKSRLVSQLEMLYGVKISNDQLSVSQRIVPPSDSVIDRAKVAKVLADKYFVQGDKPVAVLSPSSLSTYVSCHRAFLFRHVLRIDDDGEISEDAGANDVGTIYHFVMQMLYSSSGENGTSGFLVSPESKAALLADTRRIDELILKGFRDTLHLNAYSEADLNGRNLVQFNVIRKWVVQSIRTEEDGTTIWMTEKNVERLFNLKSGQTIKLKGTVDRLHTDANGQLFVADYKTGLVKKMAISELYDLFDPDKHDDNKHLLQTLTYCYMLRHNALDGTLGELSSASFKLAQDAMSPYVLSLLKIFSNKNSRVGTINKKPLVYHGDLEKDFDVALDNLINQIFATDGVWEPTQNEDTCKFCKFLRVCGKKTVS